ncbi:FdtA/QdtA family cupin domain-containing protein [Candidatus Daviesbacteria bacterium]|nr:FdtA/QdtA family cupin domain-containing protein [Candidatus Daviesbacteria bacterium]
MNKHHVSQISEIITIPKIVDEGYLCFAESNKHIPFPIKRFYFIYSVDEGVTRGKHAHKKTVQVLFCIKGKIKIILDNGSIREKVVLSDPKQGILLDKMMWHEMVEFDKDTVLLVIASDYYKPNDYIRDYDAFVKMVKKTRPVSRESLDYQIVGSARR